MSLGIRRSVRPNVVLLIFGDLLVSFHNGRFGDWIVDYRSVAFRRERNVRRLAVTTDKLRPSRINEIINSRFRICKITLPLLSHHHHLPSLR